MKLIFNALIVIQLITISCNNNQSQSNSIVQSDTTKISIQQADSFEIWQLDYYPDSILINRSINDNSDWGSDGAYNIQFSKDSCKLIGWHESWWIHLEKINEKKFRSKDQEFAYCWELKFVSSDKLLMREIYFGREKNDTGEFYPYHRVDKILTQDSLQKKIAKEIFAGTYNVLFNDTFNCKKTIVLDDKFGVKGINGITNYSFDTEIDIDFTVFNAFGLSNKSNESEKAFSFQFSADTLLIRDYKIISNPDDMDYPEIANLRIKMLKIK